MENIDAQGRAVGIPLRKYPGFQQKVWEALTKPIGAGIQFSIGRGQYRAILPRTVKDTIAAEIVQIQEDVLKTAADKAVSTVRLMASAEKLDVELAFERFIENLRTDLASRVIGPMLSRMEGFLDHSVNKPIESMAELEDELSARLTGQIEASSGEAFSHLLVNGDAESLEHLLADCLDLAVVKDVVSDYFENFASGDLYVDCSDLIRSSRVIENTDFYLHIGEIHLENHAYPIFYIPFEIEWRDRVMRITTEPHLYVNKKAVDYVTQCIGRAEGRRSTASVVRERIYYLDADQSPTFVTQNLLDEISGVLNLRAEIDFSEPRDQRSSSALVTATNRLTLSLFDKSDESMVNDYEALLTGLEGGGAVLEFFQNLVQDFLQKNPISINSEVDQEWDGTSLSDRLVFDSPLPLAEEQRRILSAIDNPKSRFISVEGPPGTGKSHTITAIAFNAILARKSLLVLSDKKEALDVVEDKLNEVLVKVRLDESFQNPILRLGKTTSNYSRILKRSTVEKIEMNSKVARQQQSDFEKEHIKERAALSRGLMDTAKAYTAINMSEIADVHKVEAEIFMAEPSLRAVNDDPRLAGLVDDYILFRGYLQENPFVLGLLLRAGGKPTALNELAPVFQAVSDLGLDSVPLRRIRSFKADMINSFTRTIDDIEDARSTIFGYWFAGTTLRDISRRLRDNFRIDIRKPHKELKWLRSLNVQLRKILEAFESSGIDYAFFASAIAIAKRPACNAPSKQVLAAAKSLQAALDEGEPLFSSGRDSFLESVRKGSEGPYVALSRFTALKERITDLSEAFKALPKLDYLGSKTRIESLNTHKLANVIDERLINFYREKKADARTLGKIIRSKQKFPTEKFSILKEAFPCIIASLRDYAEFIPLEKDLFDLVIIDEASQVSIAQALPAIIRAKKMIVLGDRHQFGNVKTSHASREINHAYMQTVFKAFDKQYPEAGSDVKKRVEFFDIKNSIVDFFELVSNYEIQLKKHFRSYPEMISFSSKYFYDDTLQVMKIRGKPLDQVIVFKEIEHDGLLDTTRNTNELEAQFILSELEKLIEAETTVSVGIITPHTEQQTFISKLVHFHRKSEEFHSRLKLKIMTFDTCQGEERDVIYYSLVATQEKDRLSYVFPKHLTKVDEDELDRNLRMQRLNVGLSRGKECIVFVCSKPIEEYNSALRTALMHYRSTVESGQNLPDVDEVDPRSPMERKVLHWLSQTPTLRNLGRAAEVQAQFELGKYLKSLDPLYNHPEYCVDFLIRITDGENTHQVIVEYDGFEFHFDRSVSTSEINQGNWQSFLTENDIEREKVLESFGVKMIRLNRFNVGKDPIATIDDLLTQRLDDLFDGRKPHELVEKLRETTKAVKEGLESGNTKHCRKCERYLPLTKFEDPNTKSGYGRICHDCKGGRPVKRYASRRLSNKRRYRNKW